MDPSKTALCLMAHPDDAEILCAGTLALLAKRGWNIVIATMTPGQAGSVVLGREEISAVRREEARHAAAVLNGSYHCLECEDVFITYDKETLLKAITLLRKVRPALVFTASPSDYMLDHEITSRITQTACLAAGIRNIAIEGTEPFTTVPHLYYSDPIQGKNIFGQEVPADLYVDISSAIDTKEEMLCCHKSQRDWLFQLSKVDEFVIMMKSFSEKNGRLIGAGFAEGFRQHLGFSYPSDDLLSAELAEFAHFKPQTV